MAESNKPVRLSKVAREFNLGMTTVVEFLASKGIEVEAKPNTKLDPETYALVRSNFQGDKEIKEKAQATSATIQERESITLASAKKRVAAKQEEEEPEIDLSQFRKSEAAPVVKRTQPVEAPAEPAAEAPKAKEEPAPAKEAEASPEAAAQEGPKVVGKVDLEALKPKKATKKVAAPKKEKEPAEAEPKAEEAPAAKPEAPKEETPAAPTEPEVVRAKVEKLSGPTVVGKIELPVERKKTAAKPGEDGKRKRVRVKKVDVSKAGGAGADEGQGYVEGRRQQGSGDGKK